MNRKTYTAQGLVEYLRAVGAKPAVIKATEREYEAAVLEEQGRRLFSEVFSR